MKEKHSKKALAHEQGGFNPAVPKPADKTQVGPLPTHDPNHKLPELKAKGDRPKPSKHQSE